MPDIRAADEEPEEFYVEFLQIVEIDTDERIAVLAAFDLDDMDAAFAELEARNLAGEVVADSHTRTVIARTYAAYNDCELPATTTDSAYIDHPPLVTIEASDLATSIRVVWDLLLHRRPRRDGTSAERTEPSSPKPKGIEMEGLEVECG